MRVFTVNEKKVQAALSMPRDLPDNGYVWIACSRTYFESEKNLVQQTLQSLTGHHLLDLHLSDLLNGQLPSRFDLTSYYDVLVFRRLASATRESEPINSRVGQMQKGKLSGPPALRRVDTSPIGFAVFDKVLLTIHPDDCVIRDAYAARLLAASGQAQGLSAQTDATDNRSTGARGIPVSPADMMLRMVSQVVDVYLDLRRDLTKQLDHWQAELINPDTRFNNWSALLEARLSLHHLDEICEDQRSAMQNWLESLNTWTPPTSNSLIKEHEILKVRSRDVLEHIDRVVHHVRRLEQSIETAVQIHFNAQSNRTNETMRTLTSITAIFLPLNLIAAIFGMNFEVIPLLHSNAGFWWAIGSMGLIALTLAWLFWRKRYWARSGR
ncbi:MAG: Magnesium transport protein CorA [Pseudomonadota bacterium]